ncbi:MAG TPA: hypothetical protein VM347_33875 [Nonomuraea sp.]|nr:hypothetical protein [Nonomuraea sp.]
MSPTDTARGKQPPVALFRAANRLVRPLLASRLHGILSRFLMLLTYTARKSGRRITVPVGYFDWEPGTVSPRSVGSRPTASNAVLLIPAASGRGRFSSYAFRPHFGAP